MPNKPTFTEAIHAVSDKLSAMSTEEWDAAMAEQSRLMDEAIINDTEHLGLALWYMREPKECKKYVNKVLDKHKKSLK